jgi:hypothetical protein
MARIETTGKTTSLWAVIESMQRRLEGEGLDAAVVDAAVTRGLETLLRRRRRRSFGGLSSLAPAEG